MSTTSTTISKPQSIGTMVAPLVRIMADAELSWSERERVSAAIEACRKHWDSMEKERQTIASQVAVGQQNYGHQNAGTNIG